MDARKIDGDRHNRVSGVQRLMQHGADVFKHVVVEMADEAVFFKQLDEAAGHDNFAVRLFPADKRLRARDALAVETVFRLVVGDEFAVFEAAHHAADELGILLLAPEHRIVVDRDAGGEFVFDRVFGDGGVVRHFGDAHGAVRDLINAGAEEKRQTAVLGGADASAQRRIDVLLRVAAEIPGKMVGVEPTGGVALAHVAAHDERDRAQQVVSGVEAVERVEGAEGDDLEGDEGADLLRRRFGERLGGALFKAELVVKLGERVDSIGDAPAAVLRGDGEALAVQQRHNGQREQRREQNKASGELRLPRRVARGEIDIVRADIVEDVPVVDAGRVTGVVAVAARDAAVVRFRVVGVAADRTVKLFDGAGGQNALLFKCGEGGEDIFLV